MVERALLEKVMQLDESARLELRDAIEASVAAEPLTPELSELLRQRVAEDDTADWESYVSLEDDELEVRARRRPVG